MDAKMDAKQKAKLERYLRNSSKFLWGLFEKKNKRKKADIFLDINERIKSKNWRNDNEDACDENKPYPHVTEELLTYGIDKLIYELIKPRVEEILKDDVHQYLKQKWYEGSLPDYTFIQRNNIDDIEAYPFLEIINNNKYQYVDRWGTFAGIWFEEIEPYLESGKAHG